ncbi:MAG: site-specific integrase [Blautia sp.]|nr:site-specific integrase [Blautia sp.]
MSRKGENIYKRKDGRWEGRFAKARRPDGRIQYGYVYAGSYQAARQKLKEAAACYHTGRASSAVLSSEESAPLGGILENWLRILKPQIKESTYNKYRNAIRLYIVPFFQERSVSSIRDADLEEFCLYLLTKAGSRKTGLSSKSAADTFSILRNVLAFAERSGFRLQCGTRSAFIRREPARMRILSHEEQRILCRYLRSEPDPRNLGILLSLFTGLRIGELCALRWGDLSLTERTLHVHATLQRIQETGETAGPKTRIVISSPKSRSSIRSIPIPEPVALLLAEAVCRDDAYVLTGLGHYVEPRSMQRYFHTVLQKLGIKEMNFHGLRHTFATRCVEAGFDVKSLSEILGHAGVTVTMNRYVHPTMEMKRKNMERLSGLLAVS